MALGLHIDIDVGEEVCEALSTLLPPVLDARIDSLRQLAIALWCCLGEVLVHEVGDVKHSSLYLGEELCSMALHPGLPSSVVVCFVVSSEHQVLELVAVGQLRNSEGGKRVVLTHTAVLLQHQRRRVVVWLVCLLIVTCEL